MKFEAQIFAGALVHHNLSLLKDCDTTITTGFNSYKDVGYFGGVKELWSLIIYYQVLQTHRYDPEVMQIISTKRALWFRNHSCASTSPKIAKVENAAGIITNKFLLH